MAWFYLFAAMRIERERENESRLLDMLQNRKHFPLQLSFLFSEVINKKMNKDALISFHFLLCFIHKHLWYARVNYASRSFFFLGSQLDIVCIYHCIYQVNRGPGRITVIEKTDVMSRWFHVIEYVNCGLLIYPICSVLLTLPWFSVFKVRL